MSQHETAKDSHCCCSVLPPDRYSVWFPGTNYSDQPLCPSGWPARIAAGTRPVLCVLCGSFPHPQLWSGALSQRRGGVRRRSFWNTWNTNICPYLCHYYSCYLILRTHQLQCAISEKTKQITSLMLQIQAQQQRKYAKFVLSMAWSLQAKTEPPQTVITSDACTGCNKRNSAAGHLFH